MNDQARAGVSVQAPSLPPVTVAVRTFYGVIWKAIGTWLQVAVDLAGVIVIARVLGPETYGTMGVVLVLVGLVRLLCAGALVECLVQRKQLERGHIDATFWSCLLIALIGAAVLVVFSPELARWLGAPQASAYLAVTALLLPAAAVAAVPAMLQERELHWADQSKAGIYASLLANLTGIWLALNGAQVWALVAMESIRTLLPLLFVWRGVSWRPGLGARLQHFRELGRFNVTVITTYVIGHLDFLLPRLVIPATLGPTALGYYMIAVRIFEELNRLVIGPFAGVSMAAVARLRSDRDATQRLILGLYRMTQLIAFPVFLGAAAVAPLIVPWAFGEKWTAAVSAVQIMLLCAIRTTSASFNVSILRATDRPDLPVWLLGFGLLLTAVLVPAMSVWGLTGIMFAILLRQLISWPLGCHFIHLATGLTLDRQLRPGVAPLIASLVMMAAVAAFMTFVATAMSVAPAAIASIGLGALVYLAILAVVQPGLLRSAGELATAALRRDQQLLARRLGETS